MVVLTVPFTILRDVKMQVDLPPLKTKAIRELGYGTNAKVLVGFKSRPWQKLGYSGSTYSDETFQLAWSNSFCSQGPLGGLTLYSGGKLGNDVGQGTAEEAAVRLMRGIERAYPGATANATARCRGFTGPHFHGRRAATPATNLGSGRRSPGPKGLPVGNLFFAGEHCSYDFQGFMNGAAQSGADAAKAVMSALSGAKAARLYSRREFVRVA